MSRPCKYCLAAYPVRLSTLRSWQREANQEASEQDKNAATGDAA